MALTEYTNILVLGIFAALFMAWGIGANDVANAFASSVGSKALTLRGAVLVAAVCEFAGAMLLGGQVADTVRGKIIDLDAFKNTGGSNPGGPELYAWGMLCALTAAGIFLLVATYFELAVSTTHSIVGAIIGVGMAYKGSSAVIWYKEKTTFPFMSGFVPIVVSWFFSPFACMIVACIFFFIVRTFLLRSKNPVQRVVWFFPVLIAVCLFINIFFILVKGAGKEIADHPLFGMPDPTSPGKRVVSDANCAWLAACIAVGAGIIIGGISMPFLKRKAAAVHDEAVSGKAAGQTWDEEQATKKEKFEREQEAANAKGKFAAFLFKAKTAVLHGTSQDVHGSIQTDDAVAKLHDHAEKFDAGAEAAFRYIQVFSAICDSFSHGANDVANSIGPFAAIYGVWSKDGVLNSKSDTPKWILAMGGAGIVIGLATYGYNIIRALGVKLVVITPSRGFCIEVASALVVTLASAYGMPVSTTHCQTGATWGVGILEGFRGINWKKSGLIFVFWMLTCVCAALFSAVLFYLSAYSPSVQMSKEIIALGH